MGTHAQTQGSRARRRDVSPGDETPRDLQAELADALDQRNQEPYHRFRDTCNAYYYADCVYQDRDAEERRLEAEYFRSTDFQTLFGLVWIIAVWARNSTTYHAEFGQPFGCSTRDSVHSLIRAYFLIADTGMFSPELAAQAQTTIDQLDPWVVVAALAQDG